MILYRVLAHGIIRYRESLPNAQRTFRAVLPVLVWVGIACSGEGTRTTQTSLSIEPAAVTVLMGDAVQLVAKGATSSVDWTTSNAAVASVAFGLVRGVGGGTATITATSGNRHAEVAVTVKRPPSLVPSAYSTLFTATLRATLPLKQQITVTSGGDAPASGLTTQVDSIPGGRGTNWLTVSAPSSSSTPATLTLQPNSTTLASGTYRANLRIISSNATNSPLIVPVTYILGFVPFVPGISLSSQAVSFVTFSKDLPSPATASISISGSNSNGDALSPLSATFSNTPSTGKYLGKTFPTWLKTSLSATTTPATLTLTVDGAPPVPDTYSVTVSVAAPGSGFPPKDIVVTFKRNATLTSDIQPIFTAGCASCHFPGNLIPDLSTVDDSYKALVGVVATRSPPLKRVDDKSTEPLMSWLYKQVTAQTGNPNYNMPPKCSLAGGINPCIPVAEADLIKVWIFQGAQK